MRSSLYGGKFRVEGRKFGVEGKAEEVGSGVGPVEEGGRVGRGSNER